MKIGQTLVLVCLIPAASLAQQSHNLPGNNNYTQSAGVTISLPWANVYTFHDYETGRSNSESGFAGFGLSFFYKKNANKWSLNTGVTTNLPAPIGAVDYGKEGTRWSIGTSFVEMNFHHLFYKRIGWIGGVNFVRYRYFFMDYDNNFQYTRLNSTLGLTAGMEYVSKRSFALALFYRPALTSFQTKQYFHMLSLDMRFDLRVWKR